MTSRLDARQRARIGNADTLFIASFHPEGGADASHRGGFPGFVRVLGDDRLVVPRLSRQRDVQHARQPRASTRRPACCSWTSRPATSCSSPARARVEPDFAVRLDVDEVRETRAASPLRFRLVEYSPAIPPLVTRHSRARGHLKG